MSCDTAAAPRAAAVAVPLPSPMLIVIDAPVVVEPISLHG